MTVYRLAKSYEDYNKCINKFGGDGRGFGDPTVMAERDGKLVGFISSYDIPKITLSAVQADSVFILMKMFDVYDKVIKETGQYQYLIHISKENKSIIKILDNWKNVRLFNEKEKFLWYVREIKDEHGTAGRGKGAEQIASGTS